MKLIGSVVSEEIFEIFGRRTDDDDGRRTPEHGYTISSPEHSAHVS